MPVRDVLCRDHSACASPVLHHDRLTEDFGHFLRHDSGDDIGATAGGETDDHLDRAVRVIGALRVDRGRRNERQGRDHAQAHHSHHPHSGSLPRRRLTRSLHEAYRF